MLKMYVGHVGGCNPTCAFQAQRLLGGKLSGDTNTAAGRASAFKVLLDEVVLLSSQCQVEKSLLPGVWPRLCMFLYAATDRADKAILSLLLTGQRAQESHAAPGCTPR